MEPDGNTLNGSRLSKRMDIRRRQICDVAGKLFATNGYQATTLEMIADELGYSKPNLYHYFKNKESIVTQLIENLAEELYSAAKGIVEEDAAPDDELFRRLIISGVEILCSHPESRVLWAFEASLHNEGTIDLDYPFATIQAYFVLVKSVFDNGRDHGLFKTVDDSVVTTFILGAISQVPRWYNPKGTLSPRQLGEQLSDIIIAGLQNNPAT